MMRNITVLLVLVTLVIAKKELRLEVPLKLKQNSTHMSLNMDLLINQRPYQISFSLEAHTSYIISLEQPPKLNEKTWGIDYRKHEESIYGIVDYIAYEKADSRLDKKTQYWQNLQNLVFHIPMKQQWVDFNKIIQVGFGDKVSSLSEGNIDLTNYRKSQFLNSIKKYNRYYKHQIVTFHMGRKNQGWVYLGDFPTNLLIKQSEYARISLNNEHWESWKVSVDSLLLQHHADGGKAETPLHEINTNYKLSLSKKVLGIPQHALKSLEKMLEGCKIQNIQEEKLFTCRQDQKKKYQNFKLVFKLTKSPINIEYSLGNLLRQTSNGVAIFNIKQSGDNDFYLSALMLKDYLLGVDFETNQLILGLKKGESWFSRDHLIKLFIIINIFVFIVSVFIIVITAKDRESSKNNGQSTSGPVNKPVQGNLRSGGYEMAEVSEETNRVLQVE